MTDEPTTARPATILERAIARAQAGAIDARTVLWTLAASDVVFINEVAPTEDEFPSQPLLVEKDGSPFLALFTHGSLAEELLEGQRTIVRAPAFEILRRLPETSGVIVNAGVRLGFEVPPLGVRAFVLDLLETEVVL